jgi:uncharacterized protein YdaU (DUF1376 family)
VTKPTKPDMWMPLFIGDYLSATTHLTTLEHGAYLLLMMHAWKNGGFLPADSERLRVITRVTREDWSTVWSTLGPYFTEQDGKLIQKRVSAEIEKWQSIRNQKVAAGKASAVVRWGNGEGNERDNGDVTDRVTGEVTKGVRKSNPSPSPSPSTSPPPPPKPKSKTSVEKGTRLSRDWTPSDELLLWCAETRPELVDATDAIVDAFKDYWCALSGAKARKLDWNATFRNRWREVKAPPKTKLNGNDLAAHNARVIDAWANDDKPSTAPKNWWETTDGIKAKAEELDFEILPGENPFGIVERLLAITTEIERRRQLRLDKEKKQA